jgi:hypothetical protein
MPQFIAGTRQANNAGHSLQRTSGVTGNVCFTAAPMGPYCGDAYKTSLKDHGMVGKQGADSSALAFAA